MGDSIHDDSDNNVGKSLGRKHPFADPEILKVYQTGSLTVVGFGGVDVPDEVCIAAYRTQLLDLIKEHQCRVLAFDLTGVKLIPSGMLGILISVRKLVDQVELYNPSEDIREVLNLTNLDSMFELKNVPV